VNPLARHLRGVLIALVVLGLSATAVLAARPLLLAADSRPDATQATDQGDQGDQANEVDNEVETPDSPEATETDQADTQDAAKTDTGATATGTFSNHGAMVSTAAQMVTPAGFANHGAFVSCVAHMGTTNPDGTPVDAASLAALTPQACAAAASARADAKAAKHAGQGKANAKHGKGHNSSH
jgi:hypothetical protein